MSANTTDNCALSDRHTDLCQTYTRIMFRIMMIIVLMMMQGKLDGCNVVKFLNFLILFGRDPFPQEVVGYYMYYDIKVNQTNMLFKALQAIKSPPPY